MNNKRLSELDSLRGIAALSVCFLHFGFYKYGITGVDLFFMISGFVIYMSISNSKSVKEFGISRFIRLFPLYWLSIIIALLFCANCTAPSPVTWNFVAGNLSMTQPLLKTTYFSAVYWTLYLEMMFYVLIAVLFSLNLLKNIEVVLSALLLSGILFHGGYILLGHTNAGIEHVYVLTRGYLPLVSYFHFFAAGIIFFRIFNEGINSLRVVLLTASFLLIALTHNISGVALYFIDWPVRLLICFVYYVAFILIITQKAPVLKMRALTFLGSISYALYLVHYTLGIWVKQMLLSGSAAVIATFAGILVSLLAASIITYWYDNPVRQWLKKILLD